MTTNKPEVVAWRWQKPIVNDHGETVGGVWKLGGAPAFPPWWTNEPLIRLKDYEALQAECEKLQSELDAHKSARIAYASEFPPNEEGQPDVGSIHQNIRKLKEECEELRKDAEFGRSVLSKREPGKVYGCHCDLEEGMEPDGCVIDEGSPHQCVYAKHISTKEQCKYWLVIVSDANRSEK